MKRCKRTVAPLNIVSDHQIATEKTAAALIAALAGASVVSLHGGIYAEMS